MRGELRILGKVVKYDPAIYYAQANDVRLVFMHESTPIVKDFDPISFLETLTQAAEVQGRQDFVARIIEERFIRLHDSLYGDAILSWELWNERKEVGKVSDLSPIERGGLENTLELFRSILRTIGYVGRLEYYELIYGEKPPKR